MNWQNKLCSQNLGLPYIVLYNGRGTDASATVVQRDLLDLEILIDHAIYWIGFYNELESYFLTAILNSEAPNEIMKDFQSSGLFGARNIHKKLLDIYFPKFDATDEIHIRLAELSKTAHEKAAKFIEENLPQNELTATRLGRYRVDIKKHLHKEMKEIDGLVKRLVGS